MRSPSLLVPVLVVAVGLGAVALAGPQERATTDDSGVRMIVDEGAAEDQWPMWRGWSRQGHVKGEGYRDRWDLAGASEGVEGADAVLWQVDVPGRGNSSPIVWDDRIFLTTARGGDELFLLAFDRADGTLLWEARAPTRGVEQIHQKNSWASATPATDGERIYTSFGTHGLVAFDFDGDELWHARWDRLDNYHGSAGSPILYRDSVIIYQDHRGASFVAAFDRESGDELWRVDRRAQTGWGTPIVITTGERDELIVSSQRRVVAYDPATGQELWFADGQLFEVIPTPVVGHGLVFTSSGRAGPTLAIRPGGSGEVTDSHVAWTSPKGSPFVPSAIVVGDYLYMINDMQSVVTCFAAETGEVMYQGRLGEARREGFSASPVAVDGKVFFTDDRGRTFVLRAGPEFELLHVNRLGERTLASPALVDGTWYWRTATRLLAIGEQDSTARSSAPGARDVSPPSGR